MNPCAMPLSTSGGSPAGHAEVSCAHAALEQQQVTVCLHVTQLGHKLCGLPAAATGKTGSYTNTTALLMSYTYSCQINAQHARDDGSQVEQARLGWAN